jgi:hypothetical protein
LTKIKTPRPELIGIVIKIPAQGFSDFDRFNDSENQAVLLACFRRRRAT